MKQWLAYIFIIVFSFQALPVKNLGKLLSKGKMTEEVQEVETGDADPELKLKKDADPFRLADAELVFTARVQLHTIKVITAIHNAAGLPVQFIPDIVTPPPDVC